MPLMHLTDRYDVEADGIAFGMLLGQASVRCLIEDEGIRDAMGGQTTEPQRVERFANRSRVESVASEKFDAGTREKNETIRVTTRDLNPPLYLPVDDVIDRLDPEEIVTTVSGAPLTLKTAVEKYMREGVFTSIFRVGEPSILHDTQIRALAKRWGISE